MTLIPTIDDATLEECACRIKPVARFRIESNTLVEDEEGDLYYIRTPKNLRTIGVNRQPVAERPACNLTEFSRVKTYHTLSSMLNASVAEVLAQIPGIYYYKTAAFEVTHPFPCPVVSEGLESYHQTTTILYSRIK